MRTDLFPYLHAIDSIRVGHFWALETLNSAPIPNPESCTILLVSRLRLGTGECSRWFEAETDVRHVVIITDESFHSGKHPRGSSGIWCSECRVAASYGQRIRARNMVYTWALYCTARLYTREKAGSQR